MKMKRLLIMGAALALAIGFSGGPALAQSSATVDIKLTIEPYAKVTLDDTSVQIKIPVGASSVGPVYLGGTVETNCDITVSAVISPPSGAPPGTWQVAIAGTPFGSGTHHNSQLLSVTVSEGEGGATYYDLTLIAKALGESQTPSAGQVVVTIMQN